MQLNSHKTHCPYCGEPIELVIDESIEEQEYTEDCFVCCRPIIVTVSALTDDTCVYVRTENE